MTPTSSVFQPNLHVIGNFMKKKNEAFEKAKSKYDAILYVLVEDFANYILGERLPLDIVEAQSGELLIPANKKITKSLIRKMVKHWYFLEIDPSPIRNRFLQIIAKYEKELLELEKEMANLQKEYTA